MEVITGGVEASTRIQERSFNHSAGERRQPAPRRSKPARPLDDDELSAREENEGHQLDDIA